jgi:histidine ammonia-lyase
MKNLILNKTTLAMVALLPNLAFAGQPLVLDGMNLSINDVVKASKGDVSVVIADSAKSKIKQSHDLLIEAARQGVPVYGLTVGVGKSKDTKIFGKDGRLTDSGIKLSQTFNEKMLLTHSASTGEFISSDVVRASMIIRLNQIATGYVGVHPDVVRAYKDFINKDIIPLIPEDGSVGVADINLASHIGSAMIGKWEVLYKGERMSSAKAMKLAGVKPLVPYAKDSLSILSNNSISVAKLLLEVEESRAIVDFSVELFPFSLEALNGNVGPFLPHSMAARPMPYSAEVASSILSNLKGSYLFEQDNKRAIQDPLSFRQAQWPIASAYAQLDSIENLVKIHINSSDDNPVISVGTKAEGYKQYSQVNQYFIEGKNVSGAINSVSNFDVTPIASTLEGYLLSYSQLGKFSSYRSLRLFDNYFTKLPRGLVAPENINGQGFYALPNGHVSLVAQLAHTTMPVSFLGAETQSGIEDTYTNLYMLASNLEKSNDLIRRVYTYELMQAAQALDLRVKHHNQKISVKSQQMLKEYRKLVKYYDNDRLISPDLKNTVKFIEDKTAPAMN